MKDEYLVINGKNIYWTIIKSFSMMDIDNYNYIFKNPKIVIKSNYTEISGMIINYEVKKGMFGFFDDNVHIKEEYKIVRVYNPVLEIKKR